ncbi:MAG: hypothetical protein QOI55_742 [Actinomycetota bacterium]|nr:hypothetical protein [Actinomycetota bacterium]
MERWIDDYHGAVEPYPELRNLTPAPTTEPAAPSRPQRDILAPPPEVHEHPELPPDRGSQPLPAEFGRPGDARARVDVAPAPPAPSPPARARATTPPVVPPAPAPTPAPTLKPAIAPSPSPDKTEAPEARAPRRPPPTEPPREDAWPTPLILAPTRPRPRSRRLLAIIIVVALIALAAGIGSFLTRDKGSPAPKASFATKWDPRVADLVSFVEREKQTTFKNPVHVDFLPTAAFTTRARTISAEPGNNVNPLLHMSTPVLRALGLAQGQVDLASAAKALEANRRSLYSTTTQRIAVRGSTIDRNTKVAIVRTLTLALDQQRFGLKTAFENDQAAWAYDALRQGDATRVVSTYVAALDPAERKGIEDPLAADIAGATGVVHVLASAPSVLGEQTVDALIAGGGNDALGRALANPPFSAEHLFDATAFINGDDPKKVDSPKLHSGESERAHGTLGALAWLVVLGEHNAPDLAIRATEGWGGDAWVTYESQNRQCIRTDWIGDNRQDLNEMSNAQAAWVTAMPPQSAQYSPNNGIITLSTCDPGPGEAITTGTSTDAFAFVVFRAAAFKDQLSQNVPVDKAWCIAQALASGATLRDAQNPDVLDSPAYANKIGQYTLDCRSPG